MTRTDQNLPHICLSLIQFTENITEKLKQEKILLKLTAKRIRIVSERDPLKLPWKQLGIDVVVESTGALTNAKDAISHIKAGAKKSLLLRLQKVLM